VTTADDALFGLRALGLLYRPEREGEWRSDCPACGTVGALLVREDDRDDPVELICGLGCASSAIGVLLPSPPPERRLLIRRTLEQRLDAPSFTGASKAALEAIDTAAYVERWTGQTPRGGYVFCPFHDDGREDTRSLRLDGKRKGWHCYGCGRGGSIFEFYAALQDREVPRGGAEFAAFVDEVARALGA